MPLPGYFATIGDSKTHFKHAPATVRSNETSIKHVGALDKSRRILQAAIFPSYITTDQRNEGADFRQKAL